MNPKTATLLALLACCLYTIVAIAGPPKHRKVDLIAFNIPRSQARGALHRFASQARASVGWNDEVAVVTIGPLQGIYTRAGALERLLANTGLEYRLTSAGYEVRPADYFASKASRKAMSEGQGQQ